ncbi:MAG TPA: FAD-binding protein, partial [Actinopolymorphaceae bacterium]
MNAVTWRNWAGTATATPRVVLDARSADEIAEAISAARDADLRVKAVGSGHSFTDIAVTDGLLVRLGRLAAILDDDPEHGLVTVQSGITLAALNRELDARGYALSNLGDIDAQTISGAISTGTHGTGLGFGGLAAQVYGLELVLAD